MHKLEYARSVDSVLSSRFESLVDQRFLCPCAKQKFGISSRLVQFGAESAIGPSGLFLVIYAIDEMNNKAQMIQLAANKFFGLKYL